MKIEVIKAIETRRSIRAYVNKPVSKEIISKILEAGCRSPSATNCQPWNIYAVTGEALENIKRENVDLFLSGADPTVEEPELHGIFKERRKDLAISLFKLLEIGRGDVEKRKEWMAWGYRYFDAPVVLIFTVDKEMLEGNWGILGIGAITQTICLAAMEYDLGTCINEQGMSYHHVLRKYVEIPEDETIINSLTIGYPDPEFPANHLICERAPLSDFVHWTGFSG